MSENTSFADLIGEKSYIKIILDLNKGVLEICPPRTPRRYRSKFEVLTLKGKKWRIAMMWNSSFHAISIKSAKSYKE